MSKAISTKLAAYEKQYREGTTSAREALYAIYDEELYGDCFETYCYKAFGIKKSMAYRQIEQHETQLRVSTIVETKLKGSHLDEVSKAPEEKQADIAADVLKACEEQKRTPTAKDFKKAVRAALPKATSGDSPPDPVQNGAVESSVGRQPGDKSEVAGVELAVKPPKPGSTKDLPGPVHKQAVSSYFSPLARATKKLADMNGGEGPVYREAKQHLNAFSAAFKKLGKGEQ